MKARFDQVLDGLESAVLGRIALHRAARRSTISFSIAALVAFFALAGGVLTGISTPRRGSSDPRSEAALLADDVGLTPSSLLASN
jgi:hypothetical protein